MRYINTKEEDKANIPPLFSKWLEDNKEEIAKKITNTDVTGDKMWAFFKDGNKAEYEELKKQLVEDQGYICCYCGQGIDSDEKTSIEHVEAKSKHKELTFDFNNLLASCNGGTKNKIHIVKEGENLISIAQQYHVDIEHLLEIWVNVDEINLFRNRFDIEDLSVGDRIVIVPKVGGKEQHCDHKKGSDPIAITPLQKDCEQHFYYLPNGKIIINEANKSTIETLGLNNNPNINRRRRDTLEVAKTIENYLEDVFEDRDERIKNRDMIIKSLQSQNPLEPFVFVTIWYLLDNVF